MNRLKRRIAFFGGTFDPCHNGHLAMAAAAADHLNLHRVYFVPAARNPLKESGPLASPTQRLEMLVEAVSHDHRFGIWEGEVYREGPSYTLHSVEHLERVYPNAHLFWIIGSDQLPNLHKWFGMGRLVQKVGFILMQRPDHAYPWPGIPGLHLYPVENPLLPISSSMIRQRLCDGAPIENWVPGAVAAYIHNNGLYAENEGKRNATLL